jgi:hypothetical protein
VPFNQPGFAANVLLSGAFHTVARIEAAAADPVDAGDMPSVVGSGA